MADYSGVHLEHGTFGEFVDFMNHAEQIGLRVIVDLVVNHTSEGVLVRLDPVPHQPG